MQGVAVNVVDARLPGLEQILVDRCPNPVARSRRFRHVSHVGQRISGVGLAARMEP